MGEGMKNFDCASHTIREINTFLHEASTRGPETAVNLLNPDSRHNIAVGITTPLSISIDGPVGYYCGGLCDGITLHLEGDAGWGLAENLMGGKVTVNGSAGSSAGATLRGGLLVIQGDAGARCGVAMKGGTIVIGGNVGYMSGFMMQKGVMIVCGDAGEAFGDSLYEGKLFVRGKACALGSDAIETEITQEDLVMLAEAFAEADMEANPTDFRKIVSGKRLYNFNTKEKEIWKLAL